jgi:hypothetical protein
VPTRTPCPGRFDALTEEQIAELVEQRAAEKAKEMYERRIALETAAVKAKMMDGL